MAATSVRPGPAESLSRRFLLRLVSKLSGAAWRFKREAQVRAALNHPNIAAIYGVEENEIVMELVQGEELRGTIPLDRALTIIYQLGDALDYTHDKGVVRCDFKLANIKVTPKARAP